MPFLETSARTANNVEAAFMTMAATLIKLRCALWPDPWCARAPRGAIVSRAVTRRHRRR